MNSNHLTKTYLCPTLKIYNKSKYKKDINDFIRRIKLKAHFKTITHKERCNSIHKKFFQKKWIPKETYPPVETFIEAFNKEFEIKQKVKKSNPLKQAHQK